MNQKHVFLALRIKKKKKHKGHIRLHREGDETCQGHPGTDQGQAGTDLGQAGTDQGYPGTDEGQPGTEQGQPGTSSKLVKYQKLIRAFKKNVSYVCDIFVNVDIG